MKKIFKTLPLALVVMSIVSCSFDENAGQDVNENPLKVITFTCTQEQDESATRAGLSEDAKKILWKSGDEIIIFDGTNNNQFTLKDESAEQTSGLFSGICSESESYVAVYPYTEGAELKGGKVEGITLPAIQNAVENSFDPAASLMIATSNTNQLNFKNAVGWIKVTTDFKCSKIELRAPGELTYIAGKGTLLYNEGEPTIEFTSDKSRTITLVSETNGGTIAAGTYYIVVPAVSLYAGWRITFTDASNGKEYIRKGSKEITFKRKTIIDLGEFKTEGDYWLDSERGIVTAAQEVDLGITISGTDSKTYKVIFAKSNLTATGLAANEYDYGDYFSWGATKPCYDSYKIGSDGKPNVDNWVESGGYTDDTAPTFAPEYYGQDFRMSDDPANKILGGDWQIPTKKVWQALCNANTNSVYWGPNNGDKSLEVIGESTIQGLKITKNDDSGTYLFLPAAGYVYGKTFDKVGSKGLYWSGTTGSSGRSAYCLQFESGTVSKVGGYNRYAGFPVRPVRLVAVD